MHAIGGQEPIFSHATATTDTYALSLHDALPISTAGPPLEYQSGGAPYQQAYPCGDGRVDQRPRSIVSRQGFLRSEEHTSELQSQSNLVCRLLLEKKKTARGGGRVLRHYGADRHG